MKLFIHLCCVNFGNVTWIGATESKRKSEINFLSMWTFLSAFTSQRCWLACYNWPFTLQREDGLVAQARYPPVRSRWYQLYCVLIDWLIHIQWCSLMLAFNVLIVSHLVYWPTPGIWYIDFEGVQGMDWCKPKILTDVLCRHTVYWLLHT